MCYLAMLEDSTGDAEVEFKFKLPKKKIYSISVTAHSATYENGKVFWVRTFLSFGEKLIISHCDIFQISMINFSDLLLRGFLYKIQPFRAVRF